MSKHLLVGLVAVAGCNLLGPDFDAPGATPLDAPVAYLAWHHEVEYCLGRERPFGAIRFYVADEVFLDDRAKYGVWIRPSSITIRTDHVDDEALVKHELVHYIEQEDDHSPAFLRCSGLGG